jgi:hypothetical protein
MYFMLKTANFVADLDQLLNLGKKIEIATKFCLMVPLMFVGFVCNLLIVVVLSRDKTMNKTTRFLLQTMALADIMFYVFCPVSDVLEFYYFFSWSGLGFKMYYTTGILMTISQTIVTWMAVIVTYQRYVAVSRPLHARQYITTSRARAAVVVVFISIFITYSPFVCLGLSSVTYLNDNVCFYFYQVIFITVTFVLPISLTVFLNIRLIIVTRRSSAFLRQQFAPGENSDSRIACNNRVTVTTIVIVIVYLICELPMTTVQILNATVGRLISSSSCEDQRIENYLFIAYNISLFFIVINSLADCVIYCIMGKSFRQTLARELFCRRNNSKK